MDKTEKQYDSIFSIGTKHGCLTILDMGEEYKTSEKYLSYIEELNSLRDKYFVNQSVSDSEEKIKLLILEFKLSYIEPKLKTHYKCKCKCGKIHYYDATTINSNPKYCFYPVSISTKYVDFENVILCDKSECVPSDDYCKYYNTYKKKQLAKKEEKLRLEIEKFREKIDNLPRVKAENYDIDFVGKYYESLYIEECCDDYLENKPKPYYSYPSSMKYCYSEILKLNSEFEILRDIITAEDFTTDKQLLPIIQNF